MRFKPFPILAALAMLVTFTACQQFDDNAILRERIKNSKFIVQEIATGAVLKGTNGINFGPDGNLYIASFLPQEII